MRRIALLSESTLLGCDDLARCAEALQTQVTRDLASTWGIDAQVRTAAEPEADEEILYLFDQVGQAERLMRTRRSIRPFGVVLLRPLLEAGQTWQPAVSRELLELLADPLVNLSAQGRFQGQPALFALDIAAPVAGDEYEIAGVPVANFVLPSWFLPVPLPEDVLVDYLGRLTEPFTLSPGGLTLYCPEIGRWQMWHAKRCPKYLRQPGAPSRRWRRTAEGATPHLLRA